MSSKLYLLPSFMFASYIALYDKRKIRCHTLNDHGKLMINHGKIKEFYFLFSVGILPSETQTNRGEKLNEAAFCCLD